MLGDHHLYGKRLMYEGSANVPMILVDRADGRRCKPGTEDPRLVGLQDVMPTLLDVAGIDVPASCEGRSMVGDGKRSHLYCEAMEGNNATRMVCDGRFKLIWYPVSGVVQLFDLDFDRDECCDLAADPAKQGDRERLERLLVGELYGADREGVLDGRLGAIASSPESPKPNRGLSGQRGLQFPAMPLDDDPSGVVGAA
jgi:arylsulfatase